MKANLFAFASYCYSPCMTKMYKITIFEAFLLIIIIPKETGCNVVPFWKVRLRLDSSAAGRDSVRPDVEVTAKDVTFRRGFTTCFSISAVESMAFLVT
jgi:hypothetical protein